MKKIIFTIITLAMFVSACSKDEVIEITPDNAIDFGRIFVDNATKATDNTYSGNGELTSFNVYGTVTGIAGTVNIFDGIQVSGEVGNDEWSYEEQYNQYWIQGADYAFIAIVDANNVTKNGYNMPTAIIYNTEGQKDLLYAKSDVENAIADQEAVNFTFNHLLSKAQFTVTSNANGGYYHTITGIKVSNFETGTYTIESEEWVGETSKEIEFGNVTEVTETSGPKTNDTQMLLIPNSDEFNVSFTVDLYKNKTKLGTENKTIKVNTDLLKGFAYNFIIECSVGNPIKFTVTNDPEWGGSTDINVL